MSLTVKIYIEHDQLALLPTLRKSDDATIEVITQANTDPDSNVFPFLIRHDDRRELETHLDEDPTVDSYELVDESGDTYIYYIEHSDRTKLLSPAVTSVNGLMLRAETRSGGWFVQLQLPDREALNAVWEYAKRHGIHFDITEVYGNIGDVSDISYGLTEEQEEALKVAYRSGYFSEPREMALSDVADEIGVSSTAMSGRLRRGMRNLISAALMEDEDVDS
ncbi:helix-turn-helix domain-containing protein [Halegenticoccus soli]|uniref:helix-turn-helix domain-containing protein n=1 Tax=Halegenticoccus soli TaxID=1985678 RepID=UPI000C6EDBBB|nr:helix-turn-helix domain-containing protein [Halegenticoccus soli]